jgi:menaquinone-dependent protoporphyrinogen oxidase
MRVLICWGSERGGTEGIAKIIGEALESRGIDAVVTSAAKVRDLSGFDAAIVGGALYANRWHRAARRFVARNVEALRRIPVWLFSSGPLDDSADEAAIEPTKEVAVLMERVGALGHATFGGRLAADAKGFPASAMAKKKSGDWRNPERITAWASDIAAALPTARPGPAADLPARSLVRLLGYGVVGWALCAAVMGGLMAVGPVWLAITLHAIAAPLIFMAIAMRYFGARGAREPLPVALAFTAIVVGLDAVVVAGLVMRSFEMFTSVAGTWLPFVLIFLATWITGFVMAMIPAPGTASARAAS